MYCRDKLAGQPPGVHSAVLIIMLGQRHDGVGNSKWLSDPLSARHKGHLRGSPHIQVYILLRLITFCFQNRDRRLVFFKKWFTQPGHHPLLTFRVTHANLESKVSSFLKWRMHRVVVCTSAFLLEHAIRGLKWMRQCFYMTLAETAGAFSSRCFLSGNLTTRAPAPDSRCFLPTFVLTYCLYFYFDDFVIRTHCLRQHSNISWSSQ